MKDPRTCKPSTPTPYRAGAKPTPLPRILMRPFVRTKGSGIVCPWCCQPTPMDYVHGHAQCVHCKVNFAPCCDGAPG